MTHVQKPYFVFRRNGRVHLNRRGASVQSTTGSRGMRISGSNAGYTTMRGSVKSTGYPLHSPVPLHFPSRASPYAIIFQLDSTHCTEGFVDLGANLNGDGSFESNRFEPQTIQLLTTRCTINAIPPTVLIQYTSQQNVPSLLFISKQ